MSSIERLHKLLRSLPPRLHKTRHTQEALLPVPLFWLLRMHHLLTKWNHGKLHIQQADNAPVICSRWLSEEELIDPLKRKEPHWHVSDRLPRCSPPDMPFFSLLYLWCSSVGRDNDGFEWIWELILSQDMKNSQMHKLGHWLAQGLRVCEVKKHRVKRDRNEKAGWDQKKSSSLCLMFSRKMRLVIKCQSTTVHVPT